MLISLPLSIILIFSLSLSAHSFHSFECMCSFVKPHFHLLPICSTLPKKAWIKIYELIWKCGCHGKSSANEYLMEIIRSEYRYKAISHENFPSFQPNKSQDHSDGEKLWILELFPEVFGKVTHFVVVVNIKKLSSDAVINTK